MVMTTIWVPLFAPPLFVFRGLLFLARGSWSRTRSWAWTSATVTRLSLMLLSWRLYGWRVWWACLQNVKVIDSTSLSYGEYLGWFASPSTFLSANIWWPVSQACWTWWVGQHLRGQLVLAPFCSSWWGVWSADRPLSAAVATTLERWTRLKEENTWVKQTSEYIECQCLELATLVKGLVFRGIGHVQLGTLFKVVSVKTVIPDGRAHIVERPFEIWVCTISITRNGW